ncbi:uncharacterized protein LOC100679989 isoform X2 [Nasonia vitripennis]|uniref:Uncharacterized protein n=1 Tax=Nasonia vitripennis TaxID=7425 RepID=A0A7M7HDG7_NASVI|nr:uncharacterized protein LOC100679989 isoform X2 [Nasonia vitripennis]
MPFFTIEFANSSESCFIKADSLDDIITGTREKLELPDANYKVVLEDKKTKVDDDFIEYASQNPKEIMKLFMMTHDESHNTNNNTKDKESIAPSDEAQPSTLNSTATSSKQLNLQSGVWNKVCPDLMDKILKGEMIEFTEKQQIVKKIAEYMVYLKDTKRGTAQKIAEIICKTYPRTFADKIEGVEWSDGIATLRTSILNCANYKTGTKKRKANMDNDEDENEVRRREHDNPRNQDEYGCTQYAPDLPSDENIKSQEERRLKLIDLFERLDHGQPEVLELMDKTYAMQRKSINDVTREISLLMTEWPFLTDDKCLIQHADKLMGKCILTTWKNSLEKKVKPIRQYLKTCHTLKINKSQELKDIIQDCKEATETRKDNYPKNAIIFPLLVLYFEENIELLYKIVDSALNEDAILEICANNNHPVLIIRGKTLYDSESTCTIILEGKTVIYCSDFLDGILLTFLSYYIFGYKYPAGLEKTLEFIQRILLQINPPIGTKTAPGKKRRTKSYNSAVFSLAKALSNFSDSFKTT